MVSAADLDDVGGMPAARAFGVEGMNSSAFHGGDGVFDKARLVQRVRVDHHLNVHRIGHREAAVDGRRRRAPILMQLHRAGARVDLFLKRCGQACVALTRKSEVHREGICRLHHAAKVPGTGGTGGGQGPMGWPGASAQHCGEARVQGILDLLWADEVNVAIKPASGQDPAFARNGFGARADDDVDARLRVRVARLADLVNATVLQTHVCFVDTGVIHDQSIGDDRIHGPISAGGLSLAHAVADDFAAAEFDLFTIVQRV